MTNILIAYATTDGQTGKIAQHLAEQLEKLGNKVALHRLTKSDQGPPPEGYDAVLVGSSVRFDKYASELTHYIDEHHKALDKIATVGFFSVSGVAASSLPEIRSKGETYMANFETAHHWQPRLQVSFAGAIKYRQYNPVLRWVMKRISKKSGRDTDTSRDWEYTDWQQVDAFASDVDKMARTN